MTDRDELRATAQYSAEDYAFLLADAWSIAVEAERLPLDAMIWHAEQAEALGPIIDPTLYSIARSWAILGPLARALRDMVTAAQRAAERRADS